jgi:hypothetical protein
LKISPALGVIPIIAGMIFASVMTSQVILRLFEAVSQRRMQAD